MKRFLLIAVAFGATAILVKVGTDLQAVRQEPTPASLSPTSSASTPATSSSTATASTPKPDSIKVDRDPSTVFQRSFWRRLDESVRVTAAERREWLEAGTTVQKWEWFIALETKPEFRRWLLEHNPFELTRRTTPTQIAHSPTEAPSWFPTSESLAALTLYANHEGRFLVFLDEKTGRLFATDRGGGFATAAHPLK